MTAEGLRVMATTPQRSATAKTAGSSIPRVNGTRSRARTKVAGITRSASPFWTTVAVDQAPEAAPDRLEPELGAARQRDEGEGERVDDRQVGHGLVVDGVEHVGARDDPRPAGSRSGAGSRTTSRRLEARVPASRKNPMAARSRPVRCQSPGSEPVSRSTPSMRAKRPSRAASSTEAGRGGPFAGQARSRRGPPRPGAGPGGAPGGPRNSPAMAAATVVARTRLPTGPG